MLSLFKFPFKATIKKIMLLIDEYTPWQTGGLELNMFSYFLLQCFECLLVLADVARFASEM